jgi:hypothetical protein
MVSHDAITRELRIMAWAGGYERLSDEVWLLRAGHLDLGDVRVAQPLPQPTAQRRAVPVLGLFGAVLRLGRSVLGSAH